MAMLGLLTQSMIEKGSCQRRVKGARSFRPAVGKRIKARHVDNTISVRHSRRKGKFDKQWSSQK